MTLNTTSQCCKQEEPHFLQKHSCLFDIGRVLLDFDFESSLTKLIPINIENPQERIRKVLKKKDAWGMLTSPNTPYTFLKEAYIY